MAGRRGWAHGVRVRRRAGHGPGVRGASQVLLRRICVRYEDRRRACFVSEAGEEFIPRDDAHRVVGMLHTGVEHLEWGPVLEDSAGTERFPGKGTYDTGAV